MSHLHRQIHLNGRNMDHICHHYPSHRSVCLYFIKNPESWKVLKTYFRAVTLLLLHRPKQFIRNNGLMRVGVEIPIYEAIIFNLDIQFLCSSVSMAVRYSTSDGSSSGHQDCPSTRYLHLLDCFKDLSLVRKSGFVGSSIPSSTS